MPPPHPSCSISMGTLMSVYHYPGIKHNIK